MYFCTGCKMTGKEKAQGPKVIYTTFAGRQENLEIQFKYIQKLIETGHIEEVHLWDYTREVKDSYWLKSLFGRGDVLEYTAAKYEYRRIPLKRETTTSEKVFKLQFGVKGPSDAHVLFSIGHDIYEIVLGGWHNTRSVIRKNGNAYVSESFGRAIKEDAFTYYTLEWADGILTLFQGRRKMLQCSAPSSDQLLDVYLAGYHNTPIHYDLNGSQELLELPPHPAPLSKEYKYMLAPCKSSWYDYYEHYTQPRYPNHIIIKADDDVVYLDTERFGEFIKTRLENPDALLLFPNIVNNGVCAYYQQQMGLIPMSLGYFAYDTFEGQLWSSGTMAHKLHKHFLQDPKGFVAKSREKPNITQILGDRISINLFAILSKDLHIYQDIMKLPRGNFLDDELHLAVTMSKVTGRNHLIATSFVVSHLSFFKQIDAGLDVTELRKEYRLLAEQIKNI